MELDPSAEVVVYCDCGAKYVFAASHVNDAIECTNCGRRVRMKANNTTRVGAPERTALQAYAEKHGDEEKISQACHYAREHKYEQAIQLYEGVLADHVPLRDAFYGMGYCYYRLGEPQKAMMLLQLARRCGHTTALDLLRKVEGSLDPVGHGEHI